MKKLLTCISLVVGLSGCVSPVSKMLDNKFLDAGLTPPETAGVWTTAAAGGLSTIKLNQDGTGVMCEDNGRSINVYQLRNSSNLIYVQNGMSLKKIIINNDVLNVKTTLSAFNVDLKYRSDNDVSLASPRALKR